MPGSVTGRLWWSRRSWSARPVSSSNGSSCSICASSIRSTGCCSRSAWRSSSRDCSATPTARPGCRIRCRRRSRAAAISASCSSPTIAPGSSCSRSRFALPPGSPSSARGSARICARRLRTRYWCAPSASTSRAWSRSPTASASALRRLPASWRRRSTTSRRRWALTSSSSCSLSWSSAAWARSWARSSPVLRLAWSRGSPRCSFRKPRTR